MLSPLAALIATTAIMFCVAANAQCTAKAGGLCVPNANPCCEAGGSPPLECIYRMCQTPVCKVENKGTCDPDSKPHTDPKGCCKAGGSPALECINNMCQFPVCQKLLKENCNTGSGPHNDPQNCCKEGTCIYGVCQNSKPSPAPQPPPAPGPAPGPGKKVGLSAGIIAIIVIVILCIGGAAVFFWMRERTPESTEDYKALQQSS